MDVAEFLLELAGGSVRKLGSLPCAALEGVRGVGGATAARILAAVELGRRAHREQAPVRAPIRGPEDVFSLMASRLRDLHQEEFHALLLNTQHRVLRDVLVTRGILDASLIHPREVFKPAVLESASGVILVHNHPSGDPSPSPEDHAATRQLAEAGRALGIAVLDHVIIGEGSFVSMAGLGLL
jgi:DNA repair protein RadC